jgi:uncharacterized membrane protein
LRRGRITRSEARGIVARGNTRALRQKLVARVWDQVAAAALQGAQRTVDDELGSIRGAHRRTGHQRGSISVFEWFHAWFSARRSLRTTAVDCYTRSSEVEMRVGECFEFGWETFKREPGPLVFLSFVLVVAQLVLEGLGSLLLHHFAPLAGMLLSGLFAGAFMSVARKTARGATPTLEDALWPFKERQGDFLLVGLASSIGVVACCVGVLLTSFLFLFAPLCVVEGGDFKQALSRSYSLMLANPRDAIVLYVCLVALNFAGALVLGVGILATAPISALAVVKAYEQASAAALESPPELPGVV